MESIVDRLDSIIHKLNSLDERLVQLEKKVDDVHKYVPFVGWLENQGKKLTGSMAYIPKLPWKR